MQHVRGTKKNGSGHKHAYDTTGLLYLKALLQRASITPQLLTGAQKKKKKKKKKWVGGGGGGEEKGAKESHYTHTESKHVP